MIRQQFRQKKNPNSKYIIAYYVGVEKKYILTDEGVPRVFTYSEALEFSGVNRNLYWEELVDDKTSM